VTADDDGGAAGGLERRAWVVLVTIITVCFLTGIAFLVFAVWLDWD
jgi:hypothetical protein